MLRYLLCTLVIVGLVEGGPLSYSPLCGPAYVNLQAESPIQFRSPYYNGRYPSPMYCHWTAQAPENTVIEVYCPYFDILSSYLCQSDYFVISNKGLDTLSDGISYCGSGSLHLVLNTNRFVASFVSNIKNYDYYNRGFQCTLTARIKPTTSPTITVPPTWTGQCGMKNPARIVNGMTSEENEWPWQVAVRHKDYKTLFCGGVLISESWVLTAAHCAVEYPQEKIYVTLGDHWRDQNRPTQYSTGAQITKVISHENYNRNTVDNDIALLQLSEPVSYSTGVRPICFPCSVTSQTLQNQNGIVTGWGATSSGGSFTSELHEVELPLISTEECRGYLGNKVTSNMICTYKHNYDACQGDSGGPLTWRGRDGRHYLVGLVSWGFGCAGHETPGVYTKITNYLAWIQLKSGITVCP